MYELRPSTPELLEPPKTWSLASILSKCFKLKFSSWIHMQLNSTAISRNKSSNSQTQLLSQTTSTHIYPPTTWNTHYSQGYLEPTLRSASRFLVCPSFLTPHCTVSVCTCSWPPMGSLKPIKANKVNGKAEAGTLTTSTKSPGETHGKIPTNWQPSHKQIRSNLWGHVKVMYIFRWTMMWHHPVGESQTSSLVLNPHFHIPLFLWPLSEWPSEWNWRTLWR